MNTLPSIVPNMPPAPPMVQADKPAGFQSEDMISVRDILAVLQRHYKLIVLCVVAGILMGIVYILFTPPRFSSTTSIIIDPRGGNNSLSELINDSMSMKDNLMLESQLEVLRSRRLLEKVAEKAGVFEGVAVPKKSWFKEMLFGAPDVAKEAEIFAKVRQGRLQGFMGGLSVGRVRGTYVITISYTSGNPEYAAKIANLVADVYLDSELEAQYEASQRAGEWLKTRLAVLHKELTEAEKAVEAYKEANNIVQSGGRNLLSDQQISELSSNLIIARSESAQAKARYDNIQSIIRAGDPNVATNDIMNNSVIMNMRSQYMELSRVATEILRRQGKDHLAYRNLSRQMQDIQNLIMDEYRRMAESYKSEYEIAQSKEISLQRELAAVTDVSREGQRSQIALRELLRRAESTRNLYTRMLDKSNEEAERQLLPSVHARIISYATPALGASWPNKRRVLMASIVLGLAVGVGLAFVREQFEKFIWKAEDLEAATQRTCLGMLPQTSFDREKIGHLSKRWSNRDINPEELGGSFNAVGFGEVTKALDKQTGITTEIMRNVQLAVGFNKHNLNPGHAKVISFVSARPGEGKSITSCFLAKHLAKTGARVALVDCDFRRPSLTHWFFPTSKTGFYELASRIGNEDHRNIVSSISGICHKTGQDKLYFIPAKGANTSIGNLNLVSSGQMNALINDLRRVFDVILIDLPPIMNIVDARMIAHSIDSFILLAHWGKTDREIVHKALTRAPEVYQKTVGTMLTLVDTEKASRYGYYNYNYYYYYHHQPS